MTRLRLFATCLPGLEPWLLEEVAALPGIEQPEALDGGVQFTGTVEHVYRANLTLGLASHVLLRLAEFPARSFKQLVQGCAKVHWERWIPPSSEIAVRVRARRSRLYHTGAIEERVRHALGPGPATSQTSGQQEQLALHVRLFRDQCTLSLDTSGAPLHRRGYRLDGGKAPLREDLARALLHAAGWDPATPLVDPMMGSGTLLIEAALLAHGTAPGSLRRFAFMRTPLFDGEAWERVRQEVASGAAEEAAPIYGSDRHPGAIQATEANAERAGVRGSLTLARAPLGRAPLPSSKAGSPGALVTNPPYGKRTGDRSGLRSLYQMLGQVVRRLGDGWRVGLVAADRRLALRTGLPLRNALLTEHGGTKVRLMVGQLG